MRSPFDISTQYMYVSQFYISVKKMIYFLLKHIIKIYFLKRIMR